MAVCICAVVLLILASFSNVVGYQSVKSTVVNDSSLFQTRTQRATSQQQNIFTFEYLGKGQGNLLRFQIRDNRAESLIKAIEFISKMDDKEFARFTELCVQRIRQDDTLKSTNSNKIIRELCLLKTKPEIIINSYINRSNQKINQITSAEISVCRWGVFGCFAQSILFIIYFIVYILISLQVTIGISCNQHSFCFGGKCLNK